MLKLICFLLFIIYNYIIYIYSSSIFFNSIKNLKRAYLLMILNIILGAIILIFEISIPEAVFMIIYFLIICIEFRLSYNDKWLKNIFGGACFTINFFAGRFICIVFYSIIFKVPLFQIMQDYRILTIITIITLLTRIISVYIFRIALKPEHMNMIITDEDSLKFSISILGSIYVFLAINTYLLYIQKEFWGVHMLIIKISICAIIGFFAVLLYSYLFSRLKLYVVKAEKIEKELEQEELELKQLENEAIYDYFTSCFKRDFIYEKIDNLLKQNSFFCIAFIDIDGLKITNDIYGHDEGDFYIKAVAEILNSEFVGKSIGRIGGDEFLVVLEHTDIYATMKCVVRCFEKANNISKTFGKPYQTSISYGVVEVTPDNKLSRDEIIKLADTYMYNFKKSRKKNRK